MFVHGQMAPLCWTAVTLVLLLAVGNSLAAVDQNELAGIVQETLNRYTPSYESTTGGRRFPMFSLAVRVPYNKESKKYDISQVTDSGEEVRETMIKCEVYSSSRVVAATVLRWPNVVDQCPGEPVQWPDVLKICGLSGKTTWLDLKRKCSKTVRDGRADHAEYRTLQHFNSLFKNQNRNDLLLFYVLASPCDRRCTNHSSPWNILEKIKMIKQWNNYAVVFSDVFQPRNGHIIPEEDLRAALGRLGQSIGLSNIFRCTEQDPMQCTSCSRDDTVTGFCVSNS
ncbi:uncharacterized protein LOC117816345 [Notolabrus celidotus]|uniref:uncharacterized protein LOC117816345 n=1 Tax=Notolabrus celidotus TaxID=1203425 RepID=UPI00148FDCF9|nr:uncharacterized protein LOC117816345 [Notolabrus celidotus]XP_034544449.1 uncharacterized protein LOC117816345 [Notolabrus celidotus]